MHIQTPKMAHPIKETTKVTQTIISRWSSHPKAKSSSNIEREWYCKISLKSQISFGQCTTKNLPKITQNDLDILAEATNGNCGIVLLMREHNKNAEPDLTNVAHEETVDKCFYSATPRSVTDIMAALYSRNMSPQALAEKNL